jgi:hypothetical protein
MGLDNHPHTVQQGHSSQYAQNDPECQGLTQTRSLLALYSYPDSTSSTPSNTRDNPSLDAGLENKQTHGEHDKETAKDPNLIEWDGPDDPVSVQPAFNMLLPFIGTRSLRFTRKTPKISRHAENGLLPSCSA